MTFESKVDLVFMVSIIFMLIGAIAYGNISNNVGLETAKFIAGLGFILGLFFGLVSGMTSIFYFAVICDNMEAVKRKT